MAESGKREFIPISIAILTISDSRTLENDKSGDLLADKVTTAGHILHERKLIPDDIYQVRAIVSQWCIKPDIQAIITTGGTGITGRDGTPEAIGALLDKEIEGFGETFRSISYDEIGTSTIQSRTIAGVINGKFVFCLPGSTNACKTAWEKLISLQLDYRTRPCNLVELMPRLLEK